MCSSEAQPSFRSHRGGLVWLTAVFLVMACHPGKGAQATGTSTRAERPAGFGERQESRYEGCWWLGWEDVTASRRGIRLLTPDSIAILGAFVIGDNDGSRRMVTPATQPKGRAFDPRSQNWSAMTWEWLFRHPWWEYQRDSIQLHFSGGTEGFWNVTLRPQGAELVGKAWAGTGDTAEVHAVRIRCDYVD